MWKCVNSLSVRSNIIAPNFSSFSNPIGSIKSNDIVSVSFSKYKVTSRRARIVSLKLISWRRLLLFWGLPDIIRPSTFDAGDFDCVQLPDWKRETDLLRLHDLLYIRVQPPFRRHLRVTTAPFHLGLARHRGYVSSCPDHGPLHCLGIYLIIGLPKNFSSMIALTLRILVLPSQHYDVWPLIACIRRCLHSAF